MTVEEARWRIRWAPVVGMTLSAVGFAAIIIATVTAALAGTALVLAMLLASTPTLVGVWISRAALEADTAGDHGQD